MVPLDRLRPATINNTIYKPVSPDDESIQKLALTIEEDGQVLESLVVTTDGVIVSGHRRHCAAGLAGVREVPVRRINIRSTDPRFEKYLVTFNQQRVKTPAEQIREEVVRTSPDDAHNALLAAQRIEEARAYGRIEDSGLRILDPTSARRRAAISDAKRPMLEAAIAVLEQYRAYWPLTLRQVHYRLLMRKVLRNITDPKSLYVNNKHCYKDLSDLLTRARLAYLVPWESMHDPTRVPTEWVGYNNVGDYMRKQLDKFLGTYYRDLLQSQPAYVEMVVEKTTILDIAERAVRPYRVPVGVGRGYTSTTSLDETAERFRASGKDRAIILISGDLDPEGENIPEIWDRCLRDEHGIDDLTTIKVGVNPEQVKQYNLTPLWMKETSSRAAGFEAVHGKQVYEMEAFEPDILQRIMRDAVRKVLDLELFAEEQRREAEDARYLMATKGRVLQVLKECGFEGLDDGDSQEEEE